MNRLGFLKRLGALAVAAVVAEPILEALAAPHSITHGDWIIWKVDGYTIHWKKLPLFDNPYRIGFDPYQDDVNEGALTSYRMIFPDEDGFDIPCGGELDEQIGLP